MEELEISAVEGKSDLVLLEYTIETISKVDPNFKKSELKKVKLLGKQNEISEDDNQTSASKKSQSSSTNNYSSLQRNGYLY